jgi:predicted lipoprotein with Yx(FWY)xxD motif
MRATPDRSVAWLSAVAAIALIVAAACTSSNGASAGARADGSAAPGASAAASPASGGGRYGGDYDDGYGTPASAAPSSDAGVPEVYEVGVVNGRDGAYLTGEGGMTLYVFGNDSANTSTCDGGCATTWPPFTIGTGDTLKAGSGVKGKLTTFTRSDGSMQVAYGGSPLYYYSADVAAGDTKGQGFGDVWFIAQP